MAGVTRLYASCIISDGAGEENSIINIEHAWMTLAQILNLHPRPTITAIILTNFLAVCGKNLVSVYGRQAWKLFLYINDKFLPAVKSVTDASEDGGAYEKLSLLVTDVVKSQRLEAPEGQLHRTFWYT